MSGLFEVLAASPDEQKVAQQQAADKLAAAVYDVRQEFGDFLFSAASVPEFRTRVALVKTEAMKVVDRHLMPVTSVMKRVIGVNSILEKEFRTRNACYPGCEKNEAHAAKFHNKDKDKEARRSVARGADPYWDQHAHPHNDVAAEGPSSPGGVLWREPERMSEWPGMEEEGKTHGPGLHVQADGTGPALIPEGNFDAYRDRVDQGGPAKVDNHVFIPGEHDKQYTDQVTAQVRKLFTGYVNFCRINKLPLTLGALERHGQRLSSRDYLVIAMGLNKMASDYTDRTLGPGMDSNPSKKDWEHNPLIPHGHSWDDEQGHFVRDPEAPELDPGQRDPRRPPRDIWDAVEEHHGSRRGAGPDYLQKANEALTNLLNQKAEDFQNSVQSMQQALQTVQQAQAVEQANNPLNVMPPAGTVNVMPGGDPNGGGAPLPGDAGMGGDPAAGQGAPPPAATAQGLAGPVGPDPQQMAAGRRGGHPKARALL